ncbi:myosin heavy chain, non-muscle-like isoform X2 [Plodia interpunctella]|uniref:myosin heavy chain, non-muscle-like isoform X2 n=1 Tax=Plodia interpunctella TaxID=58824 RepID=UPI0023675803|nr:myosin heavy chain, non-muscle-like isoform X2 [Plodia interpunctella]
MNIDMDASNSDEYVVTALQIFDYCGADSSSTLRVDALMDKFAPFVKTNKSEYSYLRSLLDPDHDNPEITVSKLAKTLNKYSESQKAKVDHDESFNLKSGQAPQDSDSGISTDAGYQLLEELQCEVREKAHLAQQLRSQLEFTDRQHEEALATLTAEKEQLKAHLNIVREENASLCDVRRDYEEASERASACERALADATRELDSHKKRSKLLHDQLATLENEKLTLQEQLSKSKDECHRINEMYASRQSSLLEQNDSLQTSHADLHTRLQDQEEFMQQILKEKVLLEMELKDLLNKSNHTALRMDRSIDISYTEDQMLTALDTLNADSRFSQDNRLLDEESFVNALREEQGRATNMSLFDEIRLSFCNVSKFNHTHDNDTIDKSRSFDVSLTTIGTQTENCDKCSEIQSICTKTDFEVDCSCIDKVKSDIGLQTDDFRKELKDKYCQCVISNVNTTASQTDENNNTDICVKCIHYDKLMRHSVKLEKETIYYLDAISSLENDLEMYEDNLEMLQKTVSDGENTNSLLNDAIKSLQAKLSALEEACENQLKKISDLCGVDAVQTAECQTEFDIASASVQVEMPCNDCEKRNTPVPQKTLRRYLWEPLKSLFQVFAVVCFLCAVSVLYGVSRRRQVGDEKWAADGSPCRGSGSGRRISWTFFSG